MRYSIFVLAVLAKTALATYGGGGGGGGGGPYCGTTTITEVCKTATQTSYSYYPSVTETVTEKKNLCSAFVTKTATDVHTENSIIKVTVTPTETTTVKAPKVFVTVSATATVTGCPLQKRHFLESRGFAAITEDDEDEYEGLTNAERLRRGLPLAKPFQKRMYALGPQNPEPSCYPKTVRVEETKTITKSVTPTKYETTTKCGFTQTYDTTVWTTSTTTKTKTDTKTADCMTVTVTVTPTKSITVTATITVPPKKGCK